MINDWTEIGMTEDWIKIQMSQVVYSNNVQMAIDWCVTNICRTVALDQIVGTTAVLVNLDLNTIGTRCYLP